VFGMKNGRFTQRLSFISLSRLLSPKPKKYECNAPGNVHRFRGKNVFSSIYDLD